MTSLKRTFDQHAKEYRKNRPSYPMALANDIQKVAALGKGCYILEIGCGAGQATDLFVKLRPRQISIDIGSRLVEECRERFSSLSSYSFRCSSFEDYETDIEKYDLIYAATCFHWLTPGVRFVKSHSSLKPNGHLAVFSDRHLKNRGGFFTEVQDCYRLHAPELIQVPKKEKRADEIREENPLRLVATRDYDRDIKYTADEYVGLLKTFSGHIALGDLRLRSLCESIHNLIINKYEGEVIKTLTTGLKIYGKAEQNGQPGAFGAG